MARSKISSKEELLVILRARGPISGPEIAARLKMSQPTFSRLIEESGESILRVDASRPPIYAVRRSIRSLGDSIPLFRVSESGQCLPIGDLFPVYPSGYVFKAKDAKKPKLYNGIPYFLEENRHQGFIGRAFPVRNTDLNLPNRLVDWSEDDSIEAMCRRGEDSVGNLIVGRESFERFQKIKLNRNPLPLLDNLLAYYDKAAGDSLSSDNPGSSAAGEQPKFTVSYIAGKEIIHALVKFSPKIENQVSQRWSDLLIAESIALRVLKMAGLDACETSIRKSKNRTFLEVRRFDRIGKYGRRGVLSLGPIEDEYWGKRDSWFQASLRLQAAKRINEADGKRIRILSAFSDLIGNTDQHFGNLSFFFELSSKQLKLTPAYDILPMMYAPKNNEIVEQKFVVLPPNADDVEAWNHALPLAIEFWKTVSSDKRIFKDFRDIARANASTLQLAE